MMGIKFMALVIVVSFVEIKSQRNKYGSRLLQFEEPITPGASTRDLLRGSKLLKFDEPVTTKTSTTEGVKILPILKADEPVTPKTFTTEGVRSLPIFKFDEPLTPKTSTVNYNHEFEECIPLDKCTSLDWLVQNLHTVPNMSSSYIIETVKNRICGFYGRIPKVLKIFLKISVN